MNRFVLWRRACCTVDGFAAAGCSADPLKIVLTVHGATSNEFWQPVKKGFEDACGKIQADCQMLFTSTNGSIEQQAANMEAGLAGNPDALITTIAGQQGLRQDHRRCPRKGHDRHRHQRRRHRGRRRQCAAGLYRPRARGRPAIRLAKYMVTKFPKDGPVHVLVGINDPSANWSTQRASGILKGLDEYKAANPGRDIVIDKLDSGGDNATAADRVGAYLNAHPDTTAYLETGSQDVAVAHVLQDRGIAPGKVLLGGFDVESDVLQADEVRLYPGPRRPAALHAGLHAGHGSLSGQDGRARAGRHQHGPWPRLARAGRRDRQDGRAKGLR